MLALRLDRARTVLVSNGPRSGGSGSMPRAALGSLLLAATQAARNVRAPLTLRPVCLLVDLQARAYPRSERVRSETHLRYTHRVAMRPVLHRLWGGPVRVLRRPSLLRIPRLDVHSVVLLVALLLDARALFLRLLAFFLARVPHGADCRVYRPRALHLLARDEVPRTEHPDVVPPLHHVLVRACAERPRAPGAVAAPDDRVLHVAERACVRDPRPVLALLNVELVALPTRRRRWPERAHRQEEGEEWLVRERGVGRRVFVEEACSGEDVVRLLVCACITLLTLQQAIVYWVHARVVLARVIDHLRITEGRLGVDEVVFASGERNPLAVGRECSHVALKMVEQFADAVVQTRPPFRKCGPCGLYGLDERSLEHCG